jgi:hypothetical protein
MQSERMRILTMLHEGRLTPEQAEQLLQALAAGEHTQPAPPRQRTGAGPGAAVGNLGEMIEGALDAAFSPLAKANYAPVKLTERRLSRWPDGVTYSNFAVLRVNPDVPEDLLRRKIGRLVNFGQVIAPQPLLDALEDLCDENFGSFDTPEEEAEPSAGCECSPPGPSPD